MALTNDFSFIKTNANIHAVIFGCRLFVLGLMVLDVVGSADGIPVNCLGKCPKVDTGEKDTRLFLI